MSRPERLPAEKCRGFTLLEVLVAVAVAGLALVAVFGQLNQSVNTVTQLRNRTLAHWVALDRITEIRLAPGLPKTGERSDEIEMAGLEFWYRVRISETPVPDLRRIDVSVAFADNRQRIVSAASGFVAPVPEPRDIVPGGGWPAPDPYAAPGRGGIEQ